MQDTTPYDDLRAAPARIPDVFILGGPKCGTTSLFAWLAQHPDTHLPEKEPNFLSRDVFDVRGVPGALRDWDAYLARLMPPAPDGKLTGESTPRYLYSDLALEILATHPTEPRVIALLRNPIDLVQSLHGQMLRQGVETETDFAAAWARAVARGSDPAAWRDAQGRIDRRLDYPLFGALGVRVERLCALIPQDRRRILILEEGLSTDPQDTVAGLLDFLGLAPAALDLTRRNERVELKSATLNRLAVRLRRTIEALRAGLGFDVFPGRARRRRGTGLMRLLNRFNTRKPAPNQRPDPATRAMLAAHFADDVTRVRATLGRAIPSWADWPQDVEDKA